MSWKVRFEISRNGQDPFVLELGPLEDEDEKSAVLHAERIVKRNFPSACTAVLSVGPMLVSGATIDETFVDEIIRDEEEP